MGFGKDHMGALLRQNLTVGLGTLDVGVALFVTTKPAILKDFRMLKWRGHVTVRGLAAGQGQNMALYIADGDLSLSEVQAALDSNAPLGPNDGVGAGVAERFVRLVGTSRGVSSGSVNVTFSGENGSQLIEFSPRWTFATTKSWNLVVVNEGIQLTTGGVIEARGTAFGVWLR